jgi:hypothetical protein
MAISITEDKQSLISSCGGLADTSSSSRITIVDLGITPGLRVL